MRIVIIAVLCLPLIGCITPGDRMLNHQNMGAGKLIASDPDVPPHIAQAGADVYENSSALTRAIGEAKSPVPYSPEASAAARAQSKREHDTIDKVLAGIKKFVGDNIPYGGAILGALTGAWALVRKRLADKKSFSMMQGVSDFSERVPGLVEQLRNLDWKKAEDRQAAVALIRGAKKDAQKAAAAANNVYQEIRADVKAQQQAGQIKPIETRTLAELTNDPTSPVGQ